MNQPEMEAAPLLLRPQQAAHLLGGVSVKHVYDLVRERQLGCVRCPRIMIPMASVEAYIALRMEPAESTPARGATPMQPVRPAGERPPVGGCRRCQKSYRRRHPRS